MSNLETLTSISLPGENWAEIYGGRYAVSTRGRVMSFYFKDKFRLHLMIARNVCGYDRVHLHVNGKNKLVLVHRLVAQAFIPNVDNLPEVNHKDGNKQNNDVSNLEWVTKSQNKRHSIDVLKRVHPLYGKRLNDSLVFREVEQYTTSGEYVNTFHSLRVAAIECGINESNISRCANGKRQTAGGYVWKFKTK